MVKKDGYLTLVDDSKYFRSGMHDWGKDTWDDHFKMVELQGQTVSLAEAINREVRKLSNEI